MLTRMDINQFTQQAADMVAANESTSHDIRVAAELRAIAEHLSVTEHPKAAEMLLRRADRLDRGTGR